jgi:hypothetical protein
MPKLVIVLLHLVVVTVVSIPYQKWRMRASGRSAPNETRNRVSLEGSRLSISAPRDGLSQSPAPQRYCHPIPTVVNSAPVFAVSPELKYSLTELWRASE